MGTLIDTLYTQGRLTGEEVAAASLAAGPGRQKAGEGDGEKRRWEGLSQFWRIGFIVASKNKDNKNKERQQDRQDEKRIVQVMVCGGCGQRRGQGLVDEGECGPVRVRAHVQRGGSLVPRQTMGGCQGLVAAGRQRACCQVSSTAK